MGRQKEEGVTGEEMRFYRGRGGMEVTVPSWRQAGLLFKCPSLPAESFHPNDSAHFPPDRAGPPETDVNGQGAGGHRRGLARALAPMCQPQAPRFPAWWGGGLRVAKAPTSLWPPRTSS